MCTYIELDWLCWGGCIRSQLYSHTNSSLRYNYCQKSVLGDYGIKHAHLKDSWKLLYRSIRKCIRTVSHPLKILQMLAASNVQDSASDCSWKIISCCLLQASLTIIDVGRKDDHLPKLMLLHLDHTLHAASIIVPVNPHAPFPVGEYLILALPFKSWMEA